MSWTRALRAAAIGLIAALAFHSSARARPRSFSLNWVRDANATSCIASAELAKIVERALGPVFV
ncbi:MAG TPA: hypothetical protein VJR89_22430, partial [Polyangiales bacterium]|nr:hypothetical protein [Polyangiales bacterium]